MIYTCRLASFYFCFGVNPISLINELMKKVDTAAAQLLLLEMRLDSQKHANILGGILRVLKGIHPSKALWEYEIESYVDRIAVKRELENHVKMETEVLSHVEKEIGHTKDEGLKLLLQHIAYDEKKHHKDTRNNSEKHIQNYSITAKVNMPVAPLNYFSISMLEHF